MPSGGHKELPGPDTCTTPCICADEKKKELQVFAYMLYLDFQLNLKKWRGISNCKPFQWKKILKIPICVEKISKIGSYQLRGPYNWPLRSYTQSCLFVEPHRQQITGKKIYFLLSILHKNTRGDWILLTTNSVSALLKTKGAQTKY